MKNLLETLFAGAPLVSLLRIFLLNPQTSFYQRELERLTGEHLYQIQRELGRLEAIGLVSHTVSGNRKYYRLDSHCPVYPELRNLFLKTLLPQDILTETRPALEGKVLLAFIYGSYARGEEGPQSDLDLMLVSSLTNREAALWLEPMKKNLNREINPALYTPEEFRRKIHSGNHFLTAVLQEPKIYLRGGEDELKKLLSQRSDQAA